MFFLKNLWLNCPLWNQNFFFYGIAWNFWSTLVSVDQLMAILD